LEKVDAYVKKNGHGWIPYLYEEDRQLGVWCQSRRSEKRRGKLSKEKEQKLLDVGFQFVGCENTSWETNVAALLAFKKENGHCRVPTRRDKLGCWVQRLRAIHKSNELAEWKVKMLESFGFEWKLKHDRKPRCNALNDKRFDQMLEKVDVFVKKNGHGRIPQLYEADRRLGFWCVQRRRDKRRGILSKAREQKLLDVGFQFEVRKRKKKAGSNNHAIPEEVGKLDKRFHQMLEKVDVFVKKNGHGRIPQPYAEDRQLGVWCMNRRSQKRKGKLSKAREQKLLDVGFQFEVLKRKKEVGSNNHAMDGKSPAKEQQYLG
jgi:hypothetical protein